VRYWRFSARFHAVERSCGIGKATTRVAASRQVERVSPA
jgi:hypothetical protein